MRNQRYIIGPSHFATSVVERPRSPQQTDPICGLSIPQILINEKRLKVLAKVNSIEFFVFKFFDIGEFCDFLADFIGGNGVDSRIEGKSGDFWVFLLDVNTCRVVVRDDGHFSRPIVIELRKGYLVFCPDRMPDYYFVDVVELVPVFVKIGQISEQWLELGSTRDRGVQGFGSEKRLQVKQIVIILVDNVREKLVGQAVQVCHYLQRQVPLLVGRAVDMGGVLEGFGIIEPVIDGIIFLFV